MVNEWLDPINHADGHLVHLVKDEEAGSTLGHIAPDPVLDSQPVDIGHVCMWEVEGGDEEVDKGAGQALGEECLGNKPGDKVLPSSCPSVEAAQEKKLNMFMERRVIWRSHSHLMTKAFWGSFFLRCALRALGTRLATIC